MLLPTASVPQDPATLAANTAPPSNPSTHYASPAGGSWEALSSTASPVNVPMQQAPSLPQHAPGSSGGGSLPAVGGVQSASGIVIPPLALRSMLSCQDNSSTPAPHTTAAVPAPTSAPVAAQAETTLHVVVARYDGEVRQCKLVASRSTSVPTLTHLHRLAGKMFGSRYKIRSYQLLQVLQQPAHTRRHLPPMDSDEHFASPSSATARSVEDSSRVLHEVSAGDMPSAAAVIHTARSSVMSSTSSPDMRELDSDEAVATLWNEALVQVCDNCAVCVTSSCAFTHTRP